MDTTFDQNIETDIQIDGMENDRFREIIEDIVSKVSEEANMGTTLYDNGARLTFSNRPPSDT